MFKAFMAQILLFGWLSYLVAALPRTRSSGISLSPEDIALQLKSQPLTYKDSMRAY